MPKAPIPMHRAMAIAHAVSAVFKEFNKYKNLNSGLD